MPQGVGGAYIEGERENILTSKRKNTLVGSKDGNAKYMLDEIVDTSKEITVKCTVDASLYDNEYQAHMCGFKENKQIDHTSVGASYGIEGAELEGFFNGEGTKIDYYQIEEINIFFKNPIKASDMTLYSRDQNGIPRVELRYLTEIVYNTKEVKQVSALKIPSGVCLFGILFVLSYLFSAILQDLMIFSLLAFCGEVADSVVGIFIAKERRRIMEQRSAELTAKEVERVLRGRV